MGDKNRGAVLEKFINYHFHVSIYPNVLIPADGNFVIASRLSDRQVTVIDPKIRGKKQNFITAKKSLFFSSSEIKSDLIIGLHPDGATGEIMDYVVINNIPCVIVPCCHLGKYSECRDWIDFMVKFFSQAGFSVETFDLKIEGENRLVKAMPKRSTKL